MKRTSPPITRPGSSPCFQHCCSSIVSLVISSSALPALDATSSLSSVAGTLRLLPFCVYLHLWPLRFDGPSLLSSLLSCREPHRLFSSVALPPFSSLVSHIISSSTLDAFSSLSSVAGTLRLLPFCFYFHLWPSRFDSPSPLSLLQCGSSPCFQQCFTSIASRVISSSALGVTSSLSSVAGTLRLLPFCVYLHCCFCHPRLLLSLPGSVD